MKTESDSAVLSCIGTQDQRENECSYLLTYSICFYVSLVINFFPEQYDENINDESSPGE